MIDEQAREAGAQPRQGEASPANGSEGEPGPQPSARPAATPLGSASLRASLAGASAAGVEWRIEPARDADAPVLAELAVLLSARAPAPRLDATWVARGADGVPVGYLEARRAGDVLEVLALAVAPQQRRRGAARALVRRQLEQAERLGLAALHLEVRASNAEARALYAGLCFAEVGRRARYYSDGEDAVLLQRDLSARAAVA